MSYTLNEEFLQKILDIPRATGYEMSAQKTLKEYLAKNVDKIEVDRVGNLFSIINPESPIKVMLAGHMDQIGFQISHIDENGFLWFLPLGGFDTATLPGQRVKVVNQKGEIIFGAIGKKAVHLQKPEERKKAPELEKLYIDIGCKNKEEAEKLVEVGDFAVYYNPYQRLGNHRYAMSAGFDDAIGAFIVAEIMKELGKDKNFFAGVYGVSTVQEEIGLRGAIVAANKLQPEVAIAFDVGFASDVPEVEAKEVGDVKLGGGPAISVGPNLNPVVTRRLMSIAKELNIPVQTVPANRGTGTDANALQLAGAATALISIPNRYMHTASEVISLDDVENIVKLSVAFIRSITKEDTFLPY